MTHDILQSDVDLAKRLLKAKCPDSEIVAALLRRGIDQFDAERLVSDLRQGVQVRIRVEVWRVRREGQSQEETTAAAELEGEESSSRRVRPLTWFVGALFLLTCAFAVGVLMHDRKYHVQTAFLLDRMESIAGELERDRTDPASVTPRQGKLDQQAWQQFRGLKAEVNRRKLTAEEQIRLLSLSKYEIPINHPPPEQSAVKPVPSATNTPTLVLEISQAGLSFHDTHLTAENILEKLSKVLGNPTRTVPNPAAGTTSYFFDQNGFLLTGEHALKPDSIFLDFEGAGGEFGTTKPFRGAIRVGGQTIMEDTPAAMLRANPEISFTNALSDGSVLSGRNEGATLICSFRKGRDQLGSVELRLAR